jgi:hypothetical protein
MSEIRVVSPDFSTDCNMGAVTTTCMLDDPDVEVG